MEVTTGQTLLYVGVSTVLARIRIENDVSGCCLKHCDITAHVIIHAK